ncbi:MAG: fibronectin type III domain-containing protein, partial [Trebonia sp.]
MATTPRHRALARATGAGALAVGCALGGVTCSAVAANAATTRPAKVTGFAVKNGSVTTHGATLLWRKDAQATTYRIVIANASTPTEAAAYDSGYRLAGFSDTVTNLAPGTAYEAKISAGRTGDASEWTTWVYFYTTGAQGQQGPAGPKG